MTTTSTRVPARGRWRGGFAACLLGGALTLAATSASADDTARARELFDAGAQAYGVGAFAEAVRAFDAAYAAAPSPPILFSLSQALRRRFVVDKKRETAQRALDGFTRYLDQVPQGGRRTDAVQAIEALRATLATMPQADGAAPSSTATATNKATLILSSPTPGARLSLDGQAPVAVPFAGDVEPGAHKLLITAPGYLDSARELPFAAGNLITLDVPLTERPAVLQVLTNPGASILVDGRPAGEAPLTRPLELPSGRHVVTLLKNGRTALSEEVELGAGETKNFRRELFASTQRKVAVGLMAVGGGALVAGGAFAFLSFSKQASAQDILDARAKGPLSQAQLDDYDSKTSARNRWRNAAFGAGGAGGALLLTGVLLALFDEPSSSSVATKPLPPRAKEAEQPKEPATTVRTLDTSWRARVVPDFTGTYTGLSAIGQF
jgi:hypothetical protein